MIYEVGQALGKVFRERRFALLAVLAGLFVFVFATWLPNLGLVWQIITSSTIPLADKAQILTALIGSISTNFTVFSASSTIAIAILFGMNAAMIAYYIGLHRRLEQSKSGAAATSLGGLTVGLFGVGCAACGTLVLSPVLTLLGASTLTKWMPFGGEEFSMLGVAMLSVSLILTARKLSQPVACPVPG